MIYRESKPEIPPEKVPVRTLDWKFSADGLYKASEVVWHQFMYDVAVGVAGERIHRYIPDVGDQYFLLAGYCIENLLKGILCHKNPELITDVLSKEVTTHNMTQIAGKINLSLTDEEHSLLNFFSQIVIWMGKYPAPIKARDHAFVRETNPSHIRTTFKALYQTLSNKMVDECEVPEIYRNPSFFV